MNIYTLAYGNEKPDNTYIGKNLKTGLRISPGNNHHSRHIIGIPKTGKSNLMSRYIIEDIARNDKAIVVFDPHTDLVRDIALRCPPEQADRVVYFNPYIQYRQEQRILGFNPFQVQNLVAEYEERSQAILNTFAELWYKTYQFAPLMQNTLETLIRTLILAYPHCQTSFYHMLLLVELSETGDYWRHKLAKYADHNAALSQNWHEWAVSPRRTQLKEDTNSSRYKIKHVINSDILAAILFQPTSAPCFDFAKFIARKGVLLVGLHGLGKEGIPLIGSLILTQLLASVKVMAEGERLPCHIYADEFHNFNTESFVEIIDQARKFNLFCTLAHQRLNQLNGDTISAVATCDSTIVFRVPHDDATKLSKYFTTTKGYLAPRVLNKLKDWQAVVKYKDEREVKQVAVTTLAANYPENKEVFSQIWQQSLQQGRTLAEVRRYKAEVEQSPAMPDRYKAQPKTPDKADFPKKKERPYDGVPEPDESDFRQKGKRPPVPPHPPSDSDSDDQPNKPEKGDWV